MFLLRRTAARLLQRHHRIQQCQECLRCSVGLIEENEDHLSDEVWTWLYEDGSSSTRLLGVCRRRQAWEG